MTAIDSPLLVATLKPLNCDEEPIAACKPMPFTAVLNPDRSQMAQLFAASKNRALRRISDHNGGFWCWSFEQATHAEGARLLNISYDRPPGASDVVFDD